MLRDVARWIERLVVGALVVAGFASSLYTLVRLVVG